MVEERQRCRCPPAAVRQAKREAKLLFADWLKRSTGHGVDPGTTFDSQIKRIHEYKRQLLNALYIVILYNRLRDNPNLDVPSRTFFFAAKPLPLITLPKSSSSSSITWPVPSMGILLFGAG
jgi:glycogen phosphorylase